MKSILLKLDDKLYEKTEGYVIAGTTNRPGYIKIAVERYNKRKKREDSEELITREVELLQQFDPDIELKREFENASLIDLKKYK